jgi:hypothetical protein
MFRDRNRTGGRDSETRREGEKEKNGAVATAQRIGLSA